jgi:hypothetical protein
MASRGHRIRRVAVPGDLRFLSSRASAQGLISASERLLSSQVRGVTDAGLTGILTAAGLICRKIDTCADGRVTVAGRGVAGPPEKKFSENCACRGRKLLPARERGPSGAANASKELNDDLEPGHRQAVHPSDRHRHGVHSQPVSAPMWCGRVTTSDPIE